MLEKRDNRRTLNDPVKRASEKVSQLALLAPLLAENRREVSIAGTIRPIRLDTHHESEAERLGGLVRDVRHADVNERNNELSRRAKITSMAQEVSRLQTERLRYPLQATNWIDETWQCVNTMKPRSRPGNPLDHVAPEQRGCHLRAIEQAAALVSESAEESYVGGAGGAMSTFTFGDGGCSAEAMQSARSPRRGISFSRPSPRIYHWSRGHSRRTHPATTPSPVRQRWG